MLSVTSIIVALVVGVNKTHWLLYALAVKEYSLSSFITLIVNKKNVADNMRKFLLQENQSQDITDIKKHGMQYNTIFT